MHQQNSTSPTPSFDMSYEQFSCYTQSQYAKGLVKFLGKVYRPVFVCLLTKTPLDQLQLVSTYRYVFNFHAILLTIPLFCTLYCAATLIELGHHCKCFSLPSILHVSMWYVCILICLLILITTTCVAATPLTPSLHTCHTHHSHYGPKHSTPIHMMMMMTNHARLSVSSLCVFVIMFYLLLILQVFLCMHNCTP